MSKKDLTYIILIVVLTLVMGGLCLKYLSLSPLMGDSGDYDAMAMNLVQGKGFMLNNAPAGDVPPGYPVFLASVYHFFGHDYQMVKLIQFILLAGMGIIVYLITRRFLNFQPVLSLLSSLTFVFWPYFIFYSNLIVSEILFIFFFLLSIYFLLYFLKDSSLKNGLLFGGLLGIATLTRPVTLLLPFWLVFLLLVFLKLKKTYFIRLAAVILVFVAVLTPWTIRNYLCFQQLLPVSNTLPHAIGRGYMTQDYTEGSEALEPGEVNFKTMALARLKNIYLFWNPGTGGSNAQSLQEKFPIMGTLFYIYKILFFVVLGLAFWSLRLIRKNKEILLPLWFIIFYFWALHTVLYPYPRYTLPIIPLVIILAWFSLRSILNKVGEKT